ncbi:MAG TPA: hypothetical protein PJ986_18550 [Gammaproteobacteria bacterium]|nr:hypothetical protein [Gammaproteobacteria bacterium]
MRPIERACAAALAALALCVTQGRAAPADEAAVAALVFEEQLDGKCQILSAGGKLVVLRNASADRAVRYRLVRMFLGVPQGRLDGEIAPGGTPQKLGCNRVNGRPQSWRVERATLVTPTPETDP